MPKETWRMFWEFRELSLKVIAKRLCESDVSLCAYESSVESSREISWNVKISGSTPQNVFALMCRFEGRFVPPRPLNRNLRRTESFEQESQPHRVRPATTNCENHVPV